MTADRKSLTMTSTHKAGSSIAQRIVLQFCKDMNYGIEMIEKSGWEGIGPIADHCLTAHERMQDRGVFYGMFRGPYMGRMPRLMDMRMIMQLRDPRDCITSYYFSMAQSHILPSDPDRAAKFNATRTEVQGMSIDEFALNYHHFTTPYPERLAILQNIVQSHSDCLVLTYEDMVTETQTWLGAIARFLDHPIKGRLARRLNRIADFTPTSEDPGQHRRQITPGDHRRKLQPETIARLNEDLREGLTFFGYSP